MCIFLKKKILKYSQFTMVFQFVVYNKVIQIYIYIFNHVYTYSLFVMNIYIQWKRQWHPTPVLLPGKSHGRRRLVGCSPWGHEQLDTTEVTQQQQHIYSVIYMFIIYDEYTYSFSYTFPLSFIIGYNRILLFICSIYIIVCTC